MIHILREFKLTVALSPDVNKLFLSEHWSQMQLLVNSPLTNAPPWYPNTASGFLGHLFMVQSGEIIPRTVLSVASGDFISLSQARSSSSSFCSIPLLLFVGCFSCFPQIREWSPAWIHAAFQGETLSLPLWALWVQCWRNRGEKNNIILSLLIVQHGKNKSLQCMERPPENILTWK